MRQQQLHDRQKDLEQRLWEAWQEREMSDVHLPITKLAKTGVGPKKRRYNTVQGNNLSMQVWSEDLALPGMEGGLVYQHSLAGWRGCCVPMPVVKYVAVCAL